MEKEPVKVRLSTVVLILIILALVCVIAYQIKINRDMLYSGIASMQEINQLREQVAEFENKTEEVTENEENTTKKEKTTTEKKTTTDKYKEITKQLGEEELFLFEKYEENNGKITLRGVISKPYSVSSSEYKNIVSKGKYNFEGEIYDVKKDEEGRYGLYLKRYDGEQYYFRKDGNKYYLESPAEYSTIWVKTKDYRKITLDKDTKCVYSKESYIDTNSTVSKVFSKKLYWGGYFKFTFKNGKCTSVNEVVTGH